MCVHIYVHLSMLQIYIYEYMYIYIYNAFRVLAMLALFFFKSMKISPIKDDNSIL